MVKQPYRNALRTTSCWQSPLDHTTRVWRRVEGGVNVHAASNSRRVFVTAKRAFYHQTECAL